MAQAPKSTQKKTSTAKKTTAAKSDIRRVAIIGGNRVPFARSNTAYSKVSNQELLTSALRGLVDRFGLEGQRLGEVVAGAVIKHSRDFNLTRLRYPAGLRYGPRSGHSGGQQDCVRADRVRHRWRH